LGTQHGADNRDGDVLIVDRRPRDVDGVYVMRWVTASG